MVSMTDVVIEYDVDLHEQIHQFVLGNVVLTVDGCVSKKLSSGTHKSNSILTLSINAPPLPVDVRSKLSQTEPCAQRRTKFA